MENEERCTRVTLKLTGGHRIWTLKSLVNGYKYIGTYTKKIKGENGKQDI